MIEPCVSKLLEISGAALCPDRPASSWSLGTPRAAELLRLCDRRNGFYAFESALHVFPMGVECRHVTAERWNDREYWKYAYDGGADDVWCFAEDIFGEQFAIRGDAIVSFNPESAEVKHVADSVEDWACRLLVEYEYLTGYPIAHEWQLKNEPIAEGERLIPKQPFVLGGEYSVTNLYSLDAAKGMRLRADICRQVRNLPDGSRVRLRVDR